MLKQRVCTPEERYSLGLFHTLIILQLLICFTLFSNHLSCWEKLSIRTVYVNNVKEEKKRKLVIEKNMCISCPLNQVYAF